MALAFGLTVSLARLGSALNFLATPLIASETSVSFAVWVATLLSVLSFVAGILLGLSDWWALSSGRLEISTVETGETKVSFREIFTFPVPVWMLCLICMLFYNSIIPLYAVASQIMKFSGTHNYTADTASAFVSIPNIMAIVFVPLFGKMIDMWGQSLWVIASSCVLLCAGDLMILGTALEWWTIYPLYSFFVVGCSYCMFAAAIWPMVSHVASKSTVATAYGLMSSLQSAGIAVTSQLIGAIQTSSEPKWQFANPLIFFISSGFAALLAAIGLLISDHRHQDILNLSAEGRKSLLVDGVQENSSDEAEKTLLGENANQILA